MKDKITQLIFKDASIAPLVIFRIVIGCVLLYGTLRTVYNGWIKTLYVDPTFHFPFIQGISPISEIGMYTCFFNFGNFRYWNHSRWFL